MPSSEDQKSPQVQAQWSPTPFRALVLALLSGPPTLDSVFIEDEELARPSIERNYQVDIISKEFKQMFADEWMEKYDDVRFALCREMR